MASDGVEGEQQEMEKCEIVVSGIPVEIFGRSSDRYFRSLREQGQVFEPAVAVLQQLADPAATLIDVGSAIGVVAAAGGALLPQGRVVAVEADPRAVECLELALAPFGARVSVVATAAGASEGSTTFYQDPGGTAWGMISDREPSVELPLTTLDRIVEQLELDRVDVIKVDVEGLEVEVVHGATNTIERFRPLLVLELNPYCLWRYGRQLPQDVLDGFLALGKRAVAIGPDGAPMDMNSAAQRDQLLHDLSVTGSVADIVIIPDGTELDLDVSRYVPVLGVDEVVSAGEGSGAGEVGSPESDWSLRDDLVRVRRGVGRRLRSMVGRFGGR